jgi:diguanylate cyclase (GGDEF)-like protein
MIITVRSPAEAFRLSAALTAGAMLTVVALVQLVMLTYPDRGGLSQPDPRLVGFLVAGLIAAPLCGAFALILMRLGRELDEARDLAFKDALTGLPNRAATLAAMTSAISECVEKDRTGALLFIDLDHFKAINDLYGHSGGDAALRHAAAIMRETIEPDMILGRFGGEEFVCFAPDASKGAAVAMAIVLSLRATSTDHYGTEIVVRASIGVAMMGDARTPEALLANADRALYLAKSSGRDRIVHHDDIRTLNEAMKRDARGARQTPPDSEKADVAA